VLSRANSFSADRLAQVKSQADKSRSSFMTQSNTLPKLGVGAVLFSGLLAVPVMAAPAAQVSYVFGDVLHASPIMKTVRVADPRQECWQERVVYHRPQQRSESRSQTSAIMGGFIGAAIGTHVGHNKSNKRVEAVAGAILGSSIARDASRGSHSTSAVNSYVNYEQRCRTVNDYYEEEQVSGYHVTYRYNDETHQVRTRNHPGDRIKLQVKVSPVAF